MRKNKKLLQLKPMQLLTHPRNMRRFFPAAHVREMANSILAAKGVIEPLIVTKGPNGKWVVVDGHMRLAGGRILGKRCPPLDCKIVDQNKAALLLSMAIANQVRYDVDPVSEALHYKVLKNEGLSVRQISKRTGIYEARISNRIILADLDEPIQNLIVDGKLPASPVAARALLKLKSDLRIRLAVRLSENPNTKISTIERACDHLLEDKNPKKKLKRPAVELSGALHKKGATGPSIRQAAKKVCEKCNQMENKLGSEEPAWSMVVHAADDVCNNCELKNIQRICTLCPAVALLKNLVKGKDEDRQS